MFKGGKIKIITTLSNYEFKIQIINTGQLNSNQNSSSTSGFGISNTIERLKLLYGNKATFSLRDFDNEHVISEIIINT